MEKLIKESKHVKTWGDLKDYAFYLYTHKKYSKVFYNKFLENTRKYLYVEEKLNTRYYNIEEILFSKQTWKKATRKYIIKALNKALADAEKELGL